jgi:hypothetical protein
MEYAFSVDYTRAVIAVLEFRRHYGCTSGIKKASRAAGARKRKSCRAADESSDISPELTD